MSDSQQKNERMNDSIESDQSNQLPLVMAIDKDPTDVLYGVYWYIMARTRYAPIGAIVRNSGMTGVYCIIYFLWMAA